MSAKISKTLQDALDSLHDGDLVSIRVYARKKQVDLECEPINGTRVRITLTGVADFCANNMREGNIVLFAQVFDDLHQIGDAALAGLAHSDQAEHIKQYIHQWQTAVSRNRFFLLGSSYGCDLVSAFGGDIELETLL